MSGPKEPGKPDPRKLAEESQRNASLRFGTKADEEREEMAAQAARQAAAAKARAGATKPVGAGAASQQTPPPLPSKEERDAIREAKRKGGPRPRSTSGDSDVSL